MYEDHGHILVVDDHRTTRLRLSLGLRQQGHIVSEAENGRQALEKLQAESFDLVLIGNLTDYFSDDELHTLCAEIGIDYERLRGQGRAARANELEPDGDTAPDAHYAWPAADRSILQSVHPRSVPPQNRRRRLCHQP